MEEPFTLAFMPEHILTKILSYLSYGEISEMRMVCHTFNHLCSRELTRAFIRVDRWHSQLQKQIKSQLPRKESERRNHALSRFVDILSAMETRLSLLSMTYTKYIDLDLCCFIPGKVLDEMSRLLRRLQDTDSQPPRSYDLLQALRDLSTMAMEHFEENIVPMLKAQMNDSFYGSSASTPLTSLNASVPTSPFGPAMDMSLSVMSPLLDYACWPVPAVPLVNTPWRRAPLKLDVQRVQNQMQVHSAAIATMTKEYREQKVKIGDQSRIIAEQERQLQDQEGMILELKTHVQSLEKSLEVLTKSISAVVGKEIKLPETKPWEVNSMPNKKASASKILDGSEEAHSSLSASHFRHMLAEYGGDGCISNRARISLPMTQSLLPRPDDLASVYSLSYFPSPYSQPPHLSLYSKNPMMTSSTTLTSEIAGYQPMQYSVNKLCPELDSACPMSRTLTQCSILITTILHDHNLPTLCLLEPGTEPHDQDQIVVLDKLKKAQQQLHRLSEEHQGCTTCMEAAQAAATASLATYTIPSTSLYTACSMPTANPIPSTSRDAGATSSRMEALSSTPNCNQGLYNSCQELLSRLQAMQNQGQTPVPQQAEPDLRVPSSSPAAEESQQAEFVSRKGKGKGKRAASSSRSEAGDPAVEKAEASGPRRKRRKRLLQSAFLDV